MRRVTPLENAIGTCMAEIAALRYFPADELTRASIMHLIERMATTPEQVAELGRRMLAHYNEWPGPMEMRGVFCTFAKPRDGIEANCTAAGTLAASIERRALEAPDGRRAIASPEVKMLAERKRMP